MNNDTTDLLYGLLGGILIWKIIALILTIALILAILKIFSINRNIKYMSEDIEEIKGYIIRESNDMRKIDLLTRLVNQNTDIITLMRERGDI